ncbi:MAG TPA: allophanate hydrolase [Burkholderiales bacterium]|nr:allophanate hydrolase [Burkholderiales bacterium]
MPLEDLISEVYRRIEAQAANPVFIHLVPQPEALARARELEALPRELPLWGRVFAVKDNIDVAGLPTTAACPAFSYTPEKSATAVEKLLAAGAILVGKTNMDQFATGLTGTRSPYGACRNAFDPAYISGGSSSGSALAVALGMASFALGTDTAGSGRVPAAFNGVVGLKPTRGLVSSAGVVPACRSLDCVSVFAPSCAEALQVLEVIEGPDAADAYSRGGEPAVFSAHAFRFGVPAEPEFFGDSGYARLFAQAILRLRALGGTPVEVDFAPFLEAQALLYGPWVAERFAALEQHLPHMLPVTREIIESGARYSAAELFAAQHRLQALKKTVEGVFEGIELMAVPGAPSIYKISEIEAKPLELNSRLGRYTNFANLLDLAALTVPAGRREDGLPFGITLLGPAFSDRSLAALGARFAGESEIAAARAGVKLAVLGAHLSGMPLNGELTARGARLVRTTRTAPRYRLYALEGKPGLVRAADAGGAIEVEVWELAPRQFGDFVSRIAPPLGIGTLELEDGEQVKGFLCEAYAAEGRPDITGYGGWRGYLSAVATTVDP